MGGKGEVGRVSVKEGERKLMEVMSEGDRERWTEMSMNGQKRERSWKDDKGGRAGRGSSGGSRI